MTGAAPESAVAPFELATLEHEPSSIEADVGRTSHTQYLCKDHEGELIEISVDQHFVFEIPLTTFRPSFPLFGCGEVRPRHRKRTTAVEYEDMGEALQDP